jgi:hypothetical protein
MATIIDSLLVVLGVDAKPVKKGTDDINKSVESIRRKSKAAGEDISKSFAVVAKNFTLTALGIGSVIEAGRTFASVSTGIDNLGRASKNLGISANTLNVWGNAIEAAGGKAEDAQSAFGVISKELYALQTTGADANTSLLRFLKVDPRDAGGNLKQADEILLEISDAFKRVSAELGRPFAANLASQMGFTEDFFNTAVQGRKVLEQYLEQQKKLAGVTEADTENARNLSSAYKDLTQNVTRAKQGVVNFFTPTVTEGVKGISGLFTGQTVGEISQDVHDLFRSEILGGQGSEFGGDYDPNAGKTYHHAPAAATDGSVASRNNNPGNLKAVGSQPRDARGFAIFPTLEAGIAAANRQLNLYAGRGKNTIGDIIPTYAPAKDNNNVQAYIDAITKETGLKADQQLSPADRAAVLKAIFNHEDPKNAITTSQIQGAIGGTPGARIAAGGNLGANGTTNNTQGNLSIGQVIINSPTDDPAQHAGDFLATVENQRDANQANYGLRP